MLSLLRLYLKALRFQRGYMVFSFLLWGMALTGRGAPVDTPTMPLLFVFLALLLTNFIAPQHLLRTSEFIEGLPYAREKMAALILIPLSMTLLPALFILWGAVPQILFYGISLGLIGALSARSSFAFAFLPFVLVTPLLKCETYRTMTLFLFGLPYAVAAALYGTRKIRMFTWHGFRYALRYSLAVLSGLLLLEAVYLQLKTPMRFVVSERMVGVDQPEFTLFFPVLLFMFMLFAYLPFVNGLGLRSAETVLATSLKRLSTPWSRRALAFGFALLLNLPLAPVLMSFRFMDIGWKSVFNLLILGAWMNAILPNEEHHPAFNYTAIVYLFAINLTPLLPPLTLLVVAFISTVLLYDIDRLLWPPKLS